AMRREGLAALEAMATEAGLDWREEPSVDGTVGLSLVSRPVDGDRVRLEAEVTSEVDVPLSRAVIQLHSSDSTFDDVVIPIGRIDARGRAHGAVMVELMGPGPAHLERVEAFVRLGRGASVAAGDHLLTVPEVLAPPGDGPDVLVDGPGLASPPMRIALPVRVADRGGVAVDHVVVWANGRKVAWQAGSAETVTMLPLLDLEPGPNRVLVEAVDVEGRSRDVRLQILGIPMAGPAVSDATGALD
ncbi:MAG: hypothetical protein AAF602_17660, partial [Myxococcota bacterium]